jgi:hypothetical protein
MQASDCYSKRKLVYIVELDGLVDTFIEPSGGVGFK